jgi:hypothetical protein
VVAGVVQEEERAPAEQAAGAREQLRELEGGIADASFK